jgi:hypothetical protein
VKLLWVGNAFRTWKVRLPSKKNWQRWLEVAKVAAVYE